MLKKLNWPTAAIIIAALTALTVTFILAPADVVREALLGEAGLFVIVAGAMRSLRGGE